MCRHLAWIGDAIPLASLVTDPPHSLVRQSYAANDMRGGGRVSVDGFGVGWYHADGSVGRYRRAVPIWQDAYLPDLTARTSSSGFVAAVRGATAGMGSAETACAPFTDGRYLFSMNGSVPGWPGSLAPLAAALPTQRLMTLDAPTDAAVLWALLQWRLEFGSTPDEALASLIAAVADAAPGARLTCLLADSNTVWATTWVHALWSRTTSAGTVLASEPLDDDPSWTELPDGRLVVATAATVDHTPLHPEEAVTTS